MHGRFSWFRFLLASVTIGTFGSVVGDAAAFQSTSKNQVSFISKDGKIDVLIGGRRFTTLDYQSHDKPILYPILSPSQVAMTRGWPVDDDTTGESHDHPHHKSMWFSHEINGIDFWSEQGGIVKTRSADTEFADRSDNAILTQSDWIERRTQRTVLTDQTTYRFGGDQISHWIDCQIIFKATQGDLQFDDTKEGLFAIRTHRDLRLTADATGGAAAVKEVFGNAINSDGVTGKNVWGKRARWILYFGHIDNRPVSIAMYDHPTNLRHPTTWHARDYGLVAANPFGVHHFLGKEKGAGRYTVKQGDELRLRYRAEFFDGIQTLDAIEGKFQSFASKPVPR